MKGGNSFKAPLLLCPWVKSVRGNYMFEDYFFNNILSTCDGIIFNK